MRPGQDVSAVLDAYPDWQIPARVITTVPTADRQKATVLVRIGFNELDPRILPDMGVKVTFLRDDEGAEVAAARPVTLVPKSAIRTEGDRSYAFVVSSAGVVDRRAVTTGGIDGDRLEVLAGLNAGDRVVVSPPPELASGAHVVMQVTRRSIVCMRTSTGQGQRTSTSTSLAAASASTCSRASTSTSQQATSSR